MTLAPRDDEYLVTIARYGTRQTVRSDVFLNYQLYKQPDAPIGMDYFIWIVRNESRTVVVDTGFSRPAGDARGRETLIEVRELYRLLGVDPDSAPTVVLTHAHYDHVGNLGLFPSSRVVISRREYEFWMGEHARRPLFHHSVEDDELSALHDAVAGGRVELFDGTRAIAPGIELIELGGHTPGQSVLTVETAAGTVLLASDAVHYYEELEADMPFTSVASIVDMYAGFDRIRQLVASGAVQHVVSGHDPATLSRFEAAQGDLAGIAATIGDPQLRGVLA
ncbi:N-acyl homoserine lactonase family protein [Gryllotalpicola koreensis]|uniref:N-acyl homoserine lactonase family protein n=1 Tax=Gryllotalpicola koreensis TaxID=993086 RepID=A0ABP7ZZI8_9MICO